MVAVTALRAGVASGDGRALAMFWRKVREPAVPLFFAHRRDATLGPVPLDVLAPTGLEYWMARLALPGVRVQRCGVALSAWPGVASERRLVVCGLAGALRADLPAGTVVIPEEVGLPDGSVRECDAELVRILAESTRLLGLRCEMGPLLTADAIVTGTTRRHWAERGFAAVDMETGLLAAAGERVAAVRVILDTPDRPISERWEKASRAVLEPALWPELGWLAVVAPRYALRAAQVLGAALHHTRFD